MRPNYDRTEWIFTISRIRGPQAVWRATAEMPRGRDALTWLPSEAEASEWFERIDRFRVGDVEFRSSFQRESKPTEFFIHKHRALVEQYLDVFDEFPHPNVVELGIAGGGSVALTALVTLPKRQVALELDEKRVDALDELVQRLDLTDRVSLYYGVDQADRARLRAIIDDEFADEPIDLVIDDASHRLEETRASFETLFPSLRPGGLFLIEDWNQQRFSRALGEALADPGSPIRAHFERRLGKEPKVDPPNSGSAGARAVASEADDPFIITLIMELLLAQAEAGEFLSEMTVNQHMVGIRRGHGRLDPLTFRLSDLYTDHLGILLTGPSRRDI